MPNILKYRMLSDEKEGFVREYEVSPRITLLDLHNHISGSLNYDESAPTSFFSASDEWEKKREYTLFDMGDDEEGAPLSMEAITVGELALEPDNRLIYMFDLFGGRAFYLELVHMEPAKEDTDYPRVALAQGEPPEQFSDESDGAGSIFDEAMGDFDSFEGDDFYDDEY